MDIFDQHVQSTPVDSRFETVVKDVLRDKASDWKHDYYGTPTSPWQSYVNRADLTIRKMQATVRTNTALISNYSEQIRLAHLPETHKDYVPLKPKEKTKLQSAINDMVTENANLLPEISEETLAWEKYNELNEIFLETARKMKYLCEKFRTDGDLEFLRKGVTLVYTKHYFLLDKPIPEKKESATAW